MASKHQNGDRPMSDFHKKVIKKALPEVVQTMVADGVMNYLIADGIFGTDELEKVNRVGGTNDRTQYILVQIQRKPDCAYECLLSALTKDGQAHVVTIINEKAVQAVEEEDAKAREKEQRETQSALLNRELHMNQRLPICPGPAGAKEEEHLTNPSNASQLVLPLISPATRGQHVTKERQRRKTAGQSLPSTIRTNNGCMVGVKVSIYEVCTEDGNWDKPDHYTQTELEKYMWMTLSHTLTKVQPESDLDRLSRDDENKILRFLLDFQVNGREIKHVGLEPVLFIVQCVNPESLRQLIEMNKDGSLASKLEDSLTFSTLLLQIGISELTLETDISELECQLCDRILNNKEQTMNVKLLATTNGEISEERLQLVYREMHQQVKTEHYIKGSTMKRAIEGFGGELVNTQDSSILFTLRFFSIEELKLFEGNMESGELKRLFEEALITDDLKQKYNIEDMVVSLSIVDQWEYEMCRRELGISEATTFEDTLTESTTWDSERENETCVKIQKEVIELLKAENDALRLSLRRLQKEHNQCRPIQPPPIPATHSQAVTNQAAQENIAVRGAQSLASTTEDPSLEVGDPTHLHLSIKVGARKDSDPMLPDLPPLDGAADPCRPLLHQRTVPYIPPKSKQDSQPQENKLAENDARDTDSPSPLAPSITYALCLESHRVSHGDELHARTLDLEHASSTEMCMMIHDHITELHSFQELFHGRFSDDEAAALLQREHGDMRAAAAFVMMSSPSDVRAILDEEQKSWSVYKSIKNLRKDNRDILARARSGQIATTARQFACSKPHCDNVWWKRCPSRKGVSKCNKCKQRYDPLPRDKEWGWAEFSCTVDCGRSFSGYCQMGTSSPCFQCGKLVFPTRIKLPQRGSRGGPSRRDVHQCSGRNCVGGQDGEGPVCVHPQTRRHLGLPLVVTPSQPHDSTGPTVDTFLSQTDLGKEHEDFFPGLPSIPETSDEVWTP